MAEAKRNTAADATQAVREGRARAVIDAVLPAVDGGRFPVKRVAGERVAVEAHCFADGHDRLRVLLRWGLAGAHDEHEIDMLPQGNDVWLAEFVPPRAGRYRYTVVAWVDHFESWRHDLARREDAADIRVALQAGAALIDAAAGRARPSDGAILAEWSAELRRAAADDTAADAGADAGPGTMACAGANAGAGAIADAQAGKALALDAARAGLVVRYADRSLASSLSLELVADRGRAAFSSWYEMFPRSASAEPGRHGTFRDVEMRLGHLADMGFDVLYFPPIHPIGRINRKGANNALAAQPGDVGSPWAIGAVEGGHKDILPQLGTLADFRRLLLSACELGIEIALDLAFQCAPDHPYVREHPQWFKHRPDGGVQYAENPPKKYQDIYPFDFETADWRALWLELKSIVDYWIEQGVAIFRVDNPHTKAFSFWEWLIESIKRDHPEVVFLAEAFTRPKVMHRLAKLGFSQSYTYFTWRNTKQELTDYFTDLALGPGRQYYRPNVWPNTPDILHEVLQSGLRPVFAARLVLAATLAANYGIYGPTYELLESAPREPGSEEYRDSEKYQLRHWTVERADSLWSLIARVNRIRRENAALQSDAGLHFCHVDNDQLIAYLKMDAASGNVILTVVNLDPHRTQSGQLDLDIAALRLDADQPYQVHDLLSDQRYIWRGRYNYVMLDPERAPAHVFRLRRRVRSERDFDYYL
ncbi:MAG TPA: alpha-1,4-glucan--maltose-1-phosphate maltosyltransferase [Steroidobacteraceae bacterium]|nr:alpha-1,4-glucan--maltose-1-phosphate maltosyltransferase [Steroidobacteraceae bacterium]